MRKRCAVGLWINVFRPVVTDRGDVRRYVASVTLFAWIVAELGDGVQHALIFVSWTNLFEQFAVTTLVVLVIAVPIAHTMGRAHLALHLARREAERLGRTDPLTGLANRRAFYEAAERLQGGALALVIADIDRFKRINDSHGHAAGDEVIKAVGRLMQDELGGFGTVARVGGEEFAFVTVALDGAALHERLLLFRSRVAQEAVVYEGRRIHATVSAGLAARAGADFNALYAAADKALYIAKAAGRDRVVDVDRIEETAPGMLRAG